jgi:hypothetical protein
VKHENRSLRNGRVCRSPRRDQLPHGVPDAEVAIKFITQEGYGDHVLQREFMVNKVLADASTMY